MSVSNSARRATRTVGLLRIASAAFTALTLTALGHAWGDATAVPTDATRYLWVGLAIAGAAACAFAEVLVGGLAARTEERRLRAALLAAHFRATVRPLAPAPSGPTPHRKPTRQGPMSPAELVNVLTDNAERMTQYRQIYLGSTLAALVIPLVASAAIVAMDPVLGFGIMAAFPLVPLVVLGFLALFRNVSAASRKERERLTVHYLDALRNLIPIRLLGAGQRTESRLRAQGEANRRAIMRLLAGNQLVIIVLDGAFSLFLVCWSVHLISTRLADGAVTPTQAIAAVLLLTLMLEPLAQVAGFFYIGMGGRASQRAIASYLSRGVVEGHAAAGVARTSEAAVSVQGLHHDYGRGPVLRAVNLEVPRGAKVAILGPSGAGKSTLLSLLRGTTPLQRGSILIDGHDVGALQPEEVCQLSATVAQSTWLFAGTIADNLRIANPHASDADLWAALTRAHVADEVARMPRGLDSCVGERGQLISGGQAQRLSLARAFLSGRRILLLDEPTSQVDVVSEAAIIAALDEIDDGWTVIIVTHRRSLVAVADATYELIDGELLAQTTEVSA